MNIIIHHFHLFCHHIHCALYLPGLLSKVKTKSNIAEHENEAVKKLSSDVVEENLMKNASRVVDPGNLSTENKTENYQGKEAMKRFFLKEFLIKQNYLEHCCYLFALYLINQSRGI